MMIDKHKFDDQKELRKFSYGLAVILLIITAYLYLKNDTLITTLPVLTGLAVLTGLLWPKGIKPLFILFTYLGFGINLVVTNVILFLLFFVIFTSAGLIVRLFGKKFFSMGPDPELPTYWIARQEDQRRDGNFEKQF
jgi:hypothetical protein